MSKDLPPGKTLQMVLRGYKLGVNQHSREIIDHFSGSVFEEGMFDRPVFTDELLTSEVAYIRDNVRRYRMRKKDPGLFSKSRPVFLTGSHKKLWGLGNIFLLKEPRKIQIQYSRKLIEEDWFPIRNKLLQEISWGTVFVSPFISPFERRALNLILQKGGRVIHVTNSFFGDRYKPGGSFFDAFTEKRVLEVSVAGEFRRYERFGRDIYQRLNEIAELMVGTQGPSSQ